MRSAFVKALCEESKRNRSIFLLTGDLGFKVLEPFREQFSNRFVNVGVAEANLIGVAAGLAKSGFIPFAYSIATFASMRAFEQIRNDIVLQNLNVKIIGVGAGVAYGKAGPTHHAKEDIALMRTLPNMTIINPADPMEVYQATKAIIKHKGPTYLRFEHNSEIEKGMLTNNTFIIGKGKLVKGGHSLAIVTTGNKVYIALKVASLLASKNINAAIFHFPTIKPLDLKLLHHIFNKFLKVVTIEEHGLVGGFGSAVAEVLADYHSQNNPKLLRFALLENVLTSASYTTLLKYHHLTSKQIAKSILKAYVQKPT